MTARLRTLELGATRGRAAVAELMRTAREARVAHGLSQRTIAASLGISRSRCRRIERGLVPGVSIILVSRLLAVLGLELSARAYPAGEPLRDAGHAARLERLHRVVAPALQWRTEVVFPQPGDRRAARARGVYSR